MKQLNKRQDDILSFAEKEGYVSVENLAKTFTVSQQTIRRDINYLSDHEFLVRTHGGAFYSSGVKNFAYKSRKDLASDEKREIANAVAKIIPHHSSIILNIGKNNSSRKPPFYWMKNKNSEEILKMKDENNGD